LTVPGARRVPGTSVTGPEILDVFVAELEGIVGRSLQEATGREAQQERPTEEPGWALPREILHVVQDVSRVGF
jgi:hypothetical protein